jgi:hypothetical protein
MVDLRPDGQTTQTEGSAIDGWSTLGVRMSVKAALCVIRGHRWSDAEDIHESYPVLRCGRCGALQRLTAESSRAEGWMERGGRSARAGEFLDSKIQRRP